MNTIHILAIETSAANCSVSLSANGKTLLNLSIEEEKSHSQKILLLVNQILTQSQLSINQLDAIAVSAGPGSYTGLRIGVSVAKGLCLALKKPLIAVDTLYSMAMHVINTYPSFDYYVPMLDARRMEIYTMVVDAHGQIFQHSHPLILNDNSYQNLSKDTSVIFFGSGMPKFKTEIETNSSWHTIPDIIPLAAQQNFLVYQYYLSNKFANIYTFEPQYLKQFNLIIA